MQTPRNILVIRNDRLGDFMLAWPAFNVLKKLFPAAKIFALVPEYTRPVAEMCPWIDEIIIDPATTGFSSTLQLAASLKAYRLDAAICFYSRPRSAVALLLAGIRHRFAPASRIDQFFYNHRLTQRRSRSAQPEYQYNIDLANYMGAVFDAPPATPDAPPFLPVDASKRNRLRQEFIAEHQLQHEVKIIFIHCGSGGSAINLGIEQYAQLVKLLHENPKLFFVISAGPGELEQAQALSTLITECPHSILHSQDGLAAYISSLSIADMLICGSTGVLHVAGALDIATAAFYPARRSATALRWQTLNSVGKRLAFSTQGDDMSELDLQQASLDILHLLN